jgi:hypothetical protein
MGLERQTGQSGGFGRNTKPGFRRFWHDNEKLEFDHFGMIMTLAARVVGMRCIAVAIA